MRHFIIGLLLAFYVAAAYAAVNPSERKVVCYWNSTSFRRPGPQPFKLTDLDPAFSLCTHLIYGYAGINATTGELASLDPYVDFEDGLGLYRKILDYKVRFPNTKILLSVGGDADPYEETHKYLTVTETPEARRKFINSAVDLLYKYNFDGIDLAWQFPTTRIPVNRTIISSFWQGLKKRLGYGKFHDKQEPLHRDGFTSIVRDLKYQLQLHNNKILSLSILPHVNTSVYYDVNLLVPNVNFVNLLSFDKKTPLRNPSLADIPAPIQEDFSGVAADSVVNDVKFWTDHGATPDKLVLGIAAFGRTWKLPKDSPTNGKPPIKTNGPAGPGPSTQTPGLLSYPEICVRFKTGAVDKLTIYTQPSKKFAFYAYFNYNERTDVDGIWIGYEDPFTAGDKGNYAKSKGLGGIAIFDISLDDYSGICTGDRYPIIQQARSNFIQ